MKTPKKKDTHGENACYVAGCRCEKCVFEHRRRHREYYLSYNPQAGIPGKRRTGKDNTSGKVGVSYSKSNKLWRANLTHQKVKFNTTYHKTYDEAVASREEMERQVVLLNG